MSFLYGGEPEAPTSGRRRFQYANPDSIGGILGSSRRNSNASQHPPSSRLNYNSPRDNNIIVPPQSGNRYQSSVGSLLGGNPPPQPAPAPRTTQRYQSSVGGLISGSTADAPPPASGKRQVPGFGANANASNIGDVFDHSKGGGQQQPQGYTPRAHPNRHAGAGGAPFATSNGSVNGFGQPAHVPHPQANGATRAMETVAQYNRDHFKSAVEAFRAADLDGSGYLDRVEVMRICQNLGISPQDCEAALNVIGSKYGTQVDLGEFSKALFRDAVDEGLLKAPAKAPLQGHDFRGNGAVGAVNENAPIQRHFHHQMPVGRGIAEIGGPAAEVVSPGAKATKLARMIMDYKNDFNMGRASAEELIRLLKQMHIFDKGAANLVHEYTGSDGRVSIPEFAQAYQRTEGGTLSGAGGQRRASAQESTDAEFWRQLTSKMESTFQEMSKAWGIQTANRLLKQQGKLYTAVDTAATKFVTH